MVVFSPIKRLERSDLRDNRLSEYFSRGQVLNICLSDALLFVASVKDLRAVLGPFIRTLAIQLRRIVSYREIDIQELTIGNLRRIVGDLNGFRVARGPGAHNLIMRVGLASAGVPRHRLPYSFYGVKNRFYSPKTSAGENRGFGLLLGPDLIRRGIRQVGRAQHEAGDQSGQDSPEKKWECKINSGLA